MNALTSLRNWRDDLSGLEQILLAVSIIGGSLVGVLPDGSAAQRWVGATVAISAAVSAAVQRVLSAGKPPVTNG